MSASNWTDADTTRALEFWKAYQRDHDISDRIGQTVGIDPVGGGVWFGERLRDVVEAARADGVFTPVLCLRAGFDYYRRKHRRSCLKVG
jgi:hypothetical protein